MASKFARRVGEFEAKDESGVQHVIRCYQNHEVREHCDGTCGVVPLLGFMKTANGDRVVPIAPGVFHIYRDTFLIGDKHVLRVTAEPAALEWIEKFIQIDT